MADSPQSQDPVLIVGAGITGLILGQALKQKNIPFTIYERDESLTSRPQGWALTLHWALQYLPSLLSSSVLSEIENAQVDMEIARNDTGNFLFLDLSTGEVKYRIPPNRRWRVNRERFRACLVKGLEADIHWGRSVKGVHIDEDGRPRVHFTDSNSKSTHESPSVPGKMIIGTEGARSSIRQFLCPESYTNNHLPVRFTGVAVYFTESEIAPLREIDPLLFKGTHPDSGVFFWFSMLDTPNKAPPSKGNGRGEIGGDGGAKGGGEGSEKGQGMYKVQLGLSWLVHSEKDEVPATNVERLANMKTRAKGFVPFLYEVVQAIPEGTEVVEVKLQDWVPGTGLNTENEDMGKEGKVEGDGKGEGSAWDNRDGRVTLAGEAAHAMTMYRGEAANHGILDTYHLASAIERIYSGADAKTEIDQYEAEMSERGRKAVLLSRRACIEAHEWEKLVTGESAVLAKRAL